MRFSGKTDIEASADATFSQFADFQFFERFALRSGADIRRVDDLMSPGPGMIWDVNLDYKGKARRMVVELVDFNPPSSMIFAAAANALEASILVELVPLSARQTRASVTLDISPRTLPARLAVQSARLTKGVLNRKFSKRLNQFGRALQERINTA
ncbi:MAG: SRPBCC family protein [Rhodobacteraceae bacterium]|nr:SRPBCC family protein [Paracoccaceae bacterium]